MNQQTKESDTIAAHLILDDFPLNATYWRRAQQAAMGYDVPCYPGCGYSKDWPRQRAAPFVSLDHMRQCADLVEEFGVRGEFSLVPCPAGMGRLDQSVRLLEDAELAGMLELIRQRLVPRFDICPTILTHTMAMDPVTGGLLPHAESAWVAHLAARKDPTELLAYLRLAWTVLSNAGLQSTGLIVGGMNDPSGIGKEGLFSNGCHLESLGRAMFTIMREFKQTNKSAFILSGSPIRNPLSERYLAPEKCYESPDGDRLYEMHYYKTEILLDLYYGEGDALQATDKFISADLQSGLLVDHVASGKALNLCAHCGTLSCLNTGLGLKMLREILTRLRKRYGKRLQWMTALELIDWGERLAAQEFSANRK